ncbi:putative 2-nitropropane dioxygenase [Denitrovibrio acetiphilus DSM 12809]|uniref:Putative 2-nitropropane dioxygenase n=1 Tax=Denitrovibrio acetiphilus (strain DSM 12809 / NBRC 114555 / N2460) TaxID=522772 RepID=D4H1P2_DENA2|nr:nitronate monooxygenase [Denitrovibrio acetiphilus]ADD68802.1 putative 2-nitropropane dioxygenase [Denitrovibrio acetiphilus DSM 12809]
MKEYRILTGGMGAAVSNWELAKAVGECGQIGVVSGTAMDVILARRLQAGDKDGNMRRALAAFPLKSVAERIINEFFIEGGKAEDASFKPIPMFTLNPPKELLELTVAANFVEVFLAKEGHSNPVGINLMEKVTLPNLASIYGAMLGGVDYIIMGAGIPREIPSVIDAFSKAKDASIRINVEGAAKGEEYTMTFSPKEIMGDMLKEIRRPKFYAIVSSNILATTLVKKTKPAVDGLVIEHNTAGGHNAPPRGGINLDDNGEPIYGQKDEVDIEKIRALNVPFWLAGSWGEACRLKEAIAEGAQGIQIGTLFAFCKESGFVESIKKAILEKMPDVFTDPKASPTGFPFKVVNLEGTLAMLETYLKRPRICNLGYLRHVYKKEDGTLGYRCPAEPIKAYIKKGGEEADTEGRKCLCNALVANIGLPEVYKNGYVEQTLITAGDTLKKVREFIKEGADSLSVADVIDKLIGELSPSEA